LTPGAGAAPCAGAAAIDPKPRIVQIAPMLTQELGEARRCAVISGARTTVGALSSRHRARRYRSKRMLRTVLKPIAKGGSKRRFDARLILFCWHRFPPGATSPNARRASSARTRQLRYATLRQHSRRALDAGQIAAPGAQAVCPGEGTPWRRDSTGYRGLVPPARSHRDSRTRYNMSSARCHTLVPAQTGREDSTVCSSLAASAARRTVASLIMSLLRAARRRLRTKRRADGLYACAVPCEPTRMPR
jgi:hypothetical protein